MYLTALTTLLLTLPSTLAFPPHPKPPTGAVTTRVVSQLPKGTWLENFAVRANGNILGTQITGPVLYEFNPSVANGSATPVFNFASIANITSLLGITEVRPSIFAIVGAFDSNSAPIPGSNHVFLLDLTKPSSPSGKVVTVVPEAGLLNGLTTLNSRAGTVLASDSARGLVWRIDVDSGAYAVAIDQPSLKPSATVPFGINGIRFEERSGELYYTNTALTTFNKIPVDCNTGVATGSNTVIATVGSGGDDFTLAKDGTAYVADGGSNEVIKITRDGKVSVIVGNPLSLTVVGPTSVRFGRGRGEKDKLFVTTNGGLAAPINGTVFEGAKIVEIDLNGAC